jgi:hypothetical protein
VLHGALLLLEDDQMPMLLEGIRVVDWRIWQQGPVCSGQHTDEVLADILEYPAVRIADLRQRKVV